MSTIAESHRLAPDHLTVPPSFLQLPGGTDPVTVHSITQQVAGITQAGFIHFLVFCLKRGFLSLFALHMHNQRGK